MQRKLFAYLVIATLTAGTAVPALAAEAPVQVAQAGTASGGTSGETTELRALLSGVTSLILPGFGQWIFNDEHPKAIMHFAGAVVLWAIPSFLQIPEPLNRFYSAIPTLFHLYSGYDAYRGAGGKVKLVSQPTLAGWTFDAQVERFGEGRPLDHLKLASHQLSY